ncbi:MAG: GFA family protein [Sphingomonadales bacterium]|jgi:hypothetical protein
MHELTGGCQCGAVRYKVLTPSLNAGYCHCRMCQRALGNIFGTFLTVDKDKLVWIKGEPAVYRSSKIATRGFCADCGTPLYFAYDDADDVDLTVGALDEPELTRPNHHFAIESRLEAWHRPDDLPEQRSDESKALMARYKAVGD